MSLEYLWGIPGHFHQIYSVFQLLFQLRKTMRIWCFRFDGHNASRGEENRRTAESGEGDAS
jgi:hypothetical protein